MSDEDLSPEIIGKSPAILSVKEFIKKAADSDLPVLIEGESGTGKELVASSIHRNGSRSKAPFIAINCGAMPKDLLENELFGHEAGAFTGATSMKRGLFEVADSGTLFIDEIGEMEINSQVKLLRLLETRSFRRLGSTREHRADVRVIAATNRVLENQIEKGHFRADLYYRLSVLRTFLPTLAERQSDMPVLIDHFLSKICTREKSVKMRKKLSPEAAAILSSYTWPGNVRELINVLSRAAVISEGEVILLKDLPENLVKKSSTARTHAGAEIKTLDGFIEEKEKEYITEILDRFSKDKEEAARALNVSRAQFYRKLKKYGIN